MNELQEGRPRESLLKYDSALEVNVHKMFS